MDYINCTTTPTDEVIANTIKFWAKNSLEHIDVLLNGYEPSGAVLQPQFQKKLTRFYEDFQTTYNNLEVANSSGNIQEILKDFLKTNRQFIRLLERLKFEGFNGYPVVRDAVYHFIYEQKYIEQIFSPFINREQELGADSVVLNTIFNEALYEESVLGCIYSNIYFWSLIGAEHTSIIENISIDEAQLPSGTNSILKAIRRAFNQINFTLSQEYNKMDKKSLLAIYRQFRELNNIFLRVLRDFKTKDSQLLPQTVKDELPELFFSVLDHLIDKHRYIKDIDDTFVEYLKS